MYTRTSLTINKYLEEFPGLVHFIYLDRTTHRLTAPTLDFTNPETLALTTKKVFHCETTEFFFDSALTEIRFDFDRYGRWSSRAGLICRKDISRLCGKTRHSITLTFSGSRTVPYADNNFFA